jgi:hypothetical protein
LHGTHDRRLLLGAQRRRHRATVLRAPADAVQDHLHVETGFATALFDNPLHRRDRVRAQQLQHTDVLLGAALRPVLPFQRLPQFVEHRGQMPAAKDVGVVQGRRPAPETLEIVLRSQDLLVPTVATRVHGDHLTPQHHLDTIDIDLDGHLLKGSGARHAIAVGVEAHHLVFVHLRRLIQAGIERTGRQ